MSLKNENIIYLSVNFKNNSKNILKVKMKNY